jgi:hypothetical protein
MPKSRNTRAPKSTKQPAGQDTAAGRAASQTAGTVRLKIRAEGKRFQETRRRLRLHRVQFVGSPDLRTGATVTVVVTEPLLAGATDIEKLGNEWIDGPPCSSMLSRGDARRP